MLEDIPFVTFCLFLPEDNRESMDDVTPHAL